MTERTIFMEALGKDTEAQRSAYLDEACGNDPVLRQRVEKLLQSCGDAGGFLEKSVPERLFERMGAPEAPGATQGEAPASGGEEKLLFLAPSDKADSLGCLGHYEVLEIIGVGGMGIVLRAFDDKLHRVVAIKVMAAQLATNANARKRFQREAQAAAAVSHDHLVTIHAVEETNGLPYIAMQYVAGLSLQQRLDRDGPLQLHEILRIGMQTASGLAAAHAQGLIHRDIKPANILLENGVERVKITDFGLARALTDASLTQSGVVTGTPQYMAPEQAEGKAVDQRTDLFSLGSVLYAMCTGRAPFRASGTMAVLKRVCEEKPTPIRETNSDIPDWLVAVIDKLHAKDPAGRYQTAAEVAELLNQHLAHLQHPSIVPVPVTRPAKPLAASRSRVVAAVVLLGLAGGLGLAEVAGFTRLTATMAGLLASKDTPDVQNTPEKKATPAAAAAKPDPHPFVILGGKGVAERKFDTLADAVGGASAGDTIEVRGNGPFVTKPILINQRSLVLRAGVGFRPVVKLDADEPGEYLLRSNDAALVLEGLDLQQLDINKPGPRGNSLISSSGPMAKLHAANCRFLMNRRDGAHHTLTCVSALNASVCWLHNCQCIAAGHGKVGGSVLQIIGPDNGVVTVDNCLIQGIGLKLQIFHAKPSKAFLGRNTILSATPVYISLRSKIDVPVGNGTSPPIEVEMSANVVVSPVVCFNLAREFLEKEKVPSASQAEQFLKKLLAWRGNENLFSMSDAGLLRLTADFKSLSSALPLTTLDDWERFWRVEELDTKLGQPKFQGGDLVAKAASSPELLTPEDFRLRPDSAGYRAGKDKKDLGADVELVGPGPAYERWKKTPAYQQWLKDTKQDTKTEAPKAEPKAFVVLGGKGVEVRKYDTLADAVQSASDGDTIEIRGNGPFVSKPVNIHRAALTIRAGAGFRPVIKPSSEGIEKVPLLATNAALVLEGLDFAAAFPEDEKSPRLSIQTDNASLRAANLQILALEFG